MKKVPIDVNWVKTPTSWRMLTAFSECPECNQELILQPVPGYFTLCPNCGEVVAVFVLPLAIGEGKGRNICVLQCVMKDGRGNLLRTPGFFEFGEWVL